MRKKAIDELSSMRGKTGRSRTLNDWLFRPGKGRSGFGVWSSDGKMLATHKRRAVLEEYYSGMEIKRLEDV